MLNHLLFAHNWLSFWVRHRLGWSAPGLPPFVKTSIGAGYLTSLCEEAIRAEGGRTTLERICQIVYAQLESRMGPDDLATDPRGDPRWRINVKLALTALGKEGRIEQDGQRGRWRLCDQASR